MQFSADLSSKKICPACKAQNRQAAKFCRFCGANLKTTGENEKFFENGQNQVSVPFSQNQISEKPCSTALESLQKRLSSFINSLIIAKRQREIGMSVKKEIPILLFSGEAGSGKTFAANNFLLNLQKSGCISSSKIETTTAHKFITIHNSEIDIASYINSSNPGAIFIDDIQTAENSFKEILLGLSERKTETICVLAGTNEYIEKFLNENPDFADLVDLYNFPELSDENLSQILKQKLIQSGFVFDERVSKDLLACVQKSRNNASCIYKNGWIVEKDIFQKITERQAERLSKQDNITAKDLKTIIEEDLPAKTSKISTEEVLSGLDGLVGMENVKQEIRRICQTIESNRKRKEMGLSAENPKFHIVLTGNPGTGKTTVARILGKLFYAMNLLPSDKVIETSGLDLTAGYVGQTKDKVNEICSKAEGGVLFIDEAYYLAGKNGESNSFADEAVGTLLKRLEDDRGKFIVIAAGYKKEMQDFLRMNPGLESRFEYKINIDDYNAGELFQILSLNIKKSGFVFGLEAEEAAKTKVNEIYSGRQKNFANAREIRNLFNIIKMNMNSRISKLPSDMQTKEMLSTILPEDIPEAKTKQLSVKDVFKELDELVGMQNIKSAARELYNTVSVNMQLEKLGVAQKKPEIHIILTGNPGTGKTTVARIFGKLFFAMGLLPSDKVIETDRSKLVARYVGHTAVQVQKICDEAMGGVLFIDEVYTLAADDFGQEASDTLMKRMEDDRGKFVVVAAGYKDKMEEWLNTNAGLPSRFAYKFHLEDYNPDELYELFMLYSKRENLILTDNAKITAKKFIEQIWKNKNSNFANGRTIRNFFDSVVRRKNSRVVSLPGNSITKETLLTVTAEDFAQGGTDL